MRKSISIVLISLLVIVFLNIRKVNAETVNQIVLSDSQISVNGQEITKETSDDVYLTNKMDNGGTSSKSIESNVEVNNIVNITSAGTYEFSGTLTDGQISVNANNITGNVNIILNNVNITCENAPAIFVYCKDINNTKCNVTISTAVNSENTISGGKLKTSVKDFEDQEDITYYVEKGYDDDRQYYERYKYDGAISSDISLTFKGEGVLNVVALSKEGIEGKMNLTFESGTFIINSLDDGINACEDNKSVITINGGTIVVNVLDEASEGDGIDSNGSIVINGGEVFAFAHPGSDNGLDADNGITVNGGTVFATGDMAETVKSSDGSTVIQMSFTNKVNKADSILILDEDGEVVFAYKTDRSFSTFVYSSDELKDGNYSVYTGTDIVGTLDDKNVYTSIESYDLTKMTKLENSQMNPMERQMDFQQFDTTNSEEGKGMTILLIGLVIVLVVVVFLYIYDMPKHTDEK